MRSIIVFLDTQSWRRSTTIAELDDDDIAEIKSAMEHIISHFGEPLEAASINLAGIQDELEEVVEYARKYLN